MGKTTLFKESRPLRIAIALILTVPELDNIPCTFDQLVSPLIYLGGGAGKDEFAVVTHDLIHRSLKALGTGKMSSLITMV